MGVTTDFACNILSKKHVQISNTRAYNWELVEHTDMREVFYRISSRYKNKTRYQSLNVAT